MFASDLNLWCNVFNSFIKSENTMEDIILKILGVWCAMVIVALYYSFEYNR